jgi:hypothetical protein
MVSTDCVWPNFFIVGAVKCGTTTLYALLKKHPQVFLPDIKEPHFFADITPPPEARDELFPGDVKGYQRLYREARGYAAIGDASPGYLWDQGASRRIHEVSPHARIIILIRDPVVRAHSHFLMNVLHGGETLSFIDALRLDYAMKDKRFWRDRLYVDLGMYHEQVLRYFNVFGKDQVMVLLFDDLQRNPGEFLASVACHIGVDPLRLEAADSSHAHNSYREPKFQAAYRIATGRIAKRLLRTCLPHSMQEWLRSTPLLYRAKRPPLDDESRRFLQGIYDPDITRLEELLGRKIPELRKSWI